MKTFYRTFIVQLLVGVLFSPITFSQQFNANLAAKLQQTLDTQLAAFPDTKGVSASIYYPGQGFWKGASGISHPGHPITTDMEFGIASNTKLFTSVAVMKLVENNILNLNDQLNEWLPPFANVDSSITIRQLLNHTSGIADLFNNASMAFIQAHPDHVFTTAEVMAYVGPKLFNKGATTGYSNTNYFLAGLIVESATGQPVSKIIRDSILTPLQLDSTFFDGKETVLGTIAHPWQDGVDVFNISRTALNTLAGSAGAIYSTANEMTQWYQALLGGQVVTPNSLTEITTFVSPGNYGLGITKFSVGGRTVWGHGGINTGYKSRMLYDTEYKVIACGLSNSNQSAIDGAITATLLLTVINSLPAVAGAISGSNIVCQGHNSVTYTVPQIAKATSYTWTLPTGATGTSATNSITVDYGIAATSGSITVVGTNQYGNGVPSSVNITVNTLPSASISGDASVLANSQENYSIPANSGSITWSVNGGSIIAGQGTENVSISWGAFGAGIIDVTVQSQQGCSASSSMSVEKCAAATGASLALWFDASTITGINNGQSLAFTAPYTEAHPSWQDQSGNGRGAYMVGGNQILIPTYYSAGAHTINTLPAVKFDNTNDALIVNNSQAVNAGNAKTLFAAFKTGADVAAKQVIFESGSGAATHSGYNIYVYDTHIGFGVWNGSTSLWINAPCEANTEYVAQLVYDGSAGTLKVMLNGDTETSSGAPASLPKGTQYNGLGSSVQGTRMWNGFSSSTIDYPFGGSIAEVLLYNTTAASTRNQTSAYLNTKYGVDFGGNSKRSENRFEIIEGNVGESVEETNTISIQPNPANEEATVRIYSTSNEDVVINIYDALGQSFILPVKGVINVGWNEFSLQTAPLQTGTYRVVISGASIHESTSLVILK
ncbi:MAG: serine hydrolase [Ignavibacteria bacterium]|nr:serine hydrolase [Ignavibacteria bacterium]